MGHHILNGKPQGAGLGDAVKPVKRRHVCDGAGAARVKPYPPGPASVQGRKKPININNLAGLSRKWVGVKLFMCFPFSLGKRETHKQNSQEISGKGRESPGIVPG